MKSLMILSLLMSIPAMAGGARESTFVGNGGNIGDVEILVTKREIQEAMKRIGSRAERERSLCTCTEEYESHPICAPLRTLSPAQTEFCAKFLDAHAERIGELVSGPRAVEVVWTHEQIGVAENGRVRAVEAVANSRQRTMTINLDRYMDLKNYERMMLVMHELLHFEEHAGKTLVDEGPNGPFAAEDGGRQLINAVAAAVTLEAADQMVLQKYRRVLDRPQNWRKYWVEFEGGSGATTSAPSGAYGIERFSRGGIDFRAYLGPNWGVVVGGRSQVGSERIAGSVDIGEKIASYSIGATYRWFIFHDPLTFFGQSHAVFKARAGFQSAELSVTDGDSTVSDSASGPVYEIAASYYLPLLWNLWCFVGASYEMQSHQYSKIPVKYDMNKTFTSIGVSYGF